MSGVEDLYKNFGILADARGEDITKHSSVYAKIIQATKGSDGEKKLAPGFITKFFRHFPTLHESATDAILDLIEDDDAQIRRIAIKTLPDICKGSSDDAPYIKVSDVLTQLLPIEDSTDLELVKMSMATVLQLNTKCALIGMFDQIMGEDETIREKGLEYVSGPLMMNRKLFNPEVEEFLFKQIKKVMADVTGAEFEVLVGVLSKLTYVSTPEGSQELSSLISGQAELASEFTPEDTEFMDKFATCFRQALKFTKCRTITFPFIEYLCVKMLPTLDEVKEEQTRQELLQLLGEACLHPISKDIASSCIQPIYDYLLVHLPSPPDAAEEQPKFHFSVVECVLFSFHLCCQHSPDFLTGEQSSAKLKELRLRLQYFARGSQAYHNQLATALKGKNALEMKDEQNKIREVALRTTANISTLLKDFFHNPPSYKTTIVLSWIPKKKGVLQSQLQRKRVSDSEGCPPKKKHSPIRFEGSLSSKETSKKETVSIYSPPRDKFSKKFSGEVKDYETSRRGGRGGRGRSKASWRQ